MATDKMQAARNIYGSICAMLDEQNWSYEKDADSLAIHCSAQGEDIPIDVLMKVNPDLEIAVLYSKMPFTVPEHRRDVLAVAISRANYGIVDGNFDYDYRSGSILFRLTSSYSNSLISKEMLKYMLFVACGTIDEYNDKFLAICKNDMDINAVMDYIK